MEMVKETGDNVLEQIPKPLLLKILGASLLGAGVVYVLKVWNSYKFFKKRNIPTPPYSFFYGNHKEIIKDNRYSEVLREWTEKYGKTYGYYEGHLPVLVTSDLEIIQEVFVRQSAIFSARKKGPIGPSDKNKSLSLFTSSKLRWKRMRNIINPTFSGAKMKELSPLIVVCTDRLVETLGKETEKEMNIYGFYKRFTMDTIWNCAFGVDIDLQRNPENEYFKKCEQIFTPDSLNILQKLGVYFHEVKSLIFDSMIFVNGLLLKIAPFSSQVTPLVWLRSNVSEIAECRKQENTRKKDYIQLLLDAQTDTQYKELDANVALTDFGNYNLSKKLTFDEIKTNLVLFMIAGYETTSTALAYCSHVLVKYPEEQQKLYDEITAVYGDDPKNIENSEKLGELSYLDMFVKEVLRMNPIANIAVTRRATRPTSVKGIDIPEGVCVVVDVMSLHNDPEIWGPVDPKTFYPSRFSPSVKRNPLAFMTFGNGPRNCVGMKFAITEIKLALAKLVMNFEFIDAIGHPELEVKEFGVRAPKNGINVLIRKRV